MFSPAAINIKKCTSDLYINITSMLRVLIKCAATESVWERKRGSVFVRHIYDTTICQYNHVFIIFFVCVWHLGEVSSHLHCIYSKTFQMLMWPVSENTQLQTFAGIFLAAHLAWKDRWAAADSRAKHLNGQHAEQHAVFQWWALCSLRRLSTVPAKACMTFKHH